MTYVDVGTDWFNVAFKCNKELKKKTVIDGEDYKGNKHIQAEISKEEVAVGDCKGTYILTIRAFECNPVTANRLLFTVKLPYRKNEIFRIYYNLKDNTEYYIESSIGKFKVENYLTIGYKKVSDTEVLEYSYSLGAPECNWQDVTNCKLRIEKTMEPELAKRTYKELRNAGLIGKTHWDSWSQYWDICCYACTEKGQARMALSTPSWGRVLHIWDKCNDENWNEENKFAYKGNVYDKIPNAEFYLPKFWNEEEFEEVANKYKPKNPVWGNTSDYDMLCERSEDLKNNYPTFDKAWEACGCCWRDATGKVYQFEHKPNIGAYERVWSGAILEWKEDWNFDKLWNQKLSQEEIDKHGNESGGAWRAAVSREIISEEKSEGVRTILEKVVTKGWHSAPYPNSVPCPVCQTMHRFAEASDCWKPIFYGIRERIHYMNINFKK